VEVLAVLTLAREMVELLQMMAPMEQMHFKTLDLVVVAQVKRMQVQELILVVPVVPELSSLLILHKYLKSS
jgi:hypothetical protein